MENLFDEKLVKKAYSLISDKYSTEGGKKFILHLISSFIPISNKSTKVTLESSKLFKNLECCITRCKIVPVDVCVPQNEGSVYYGYISEHSDKIVSGEALEALSRFIDKRMELNDDIITKIYRYMTRKGDSRKDKHEMTEKHASPKMPKSKNSYPKNKVFKESKATSEGIEAIPNPNR